MTEMGMDVSDPDVMPESEDFPGRVEKVEILPPRGETNWGYDDRPRLHLWVRPLNHTIDGEEGSGCYPVYVPNSSRKPSQWHLFKKFLKDGGYPLEQLKPDCSDLLGKVFLWRRIEKRFFEEQERPTRMLVPVKYLPEGWSEPTETDSAATPSWRVQPGQVPADTGGATWPAPAPPQPANPFEDLERRLAAPEGMSAAQIYRWAQDHGISKEQVDEHMGKLANEGRLVNLGNNIFRLS